MIRRRAISLLLALCAIAVFAIPAIAFARTAYYTGSSALEAEGYAQSVGLETGVLGTQHPYGGEGEPGAVAITPDGGKAYVATGDFPPAVGVIDVATDKALPSVPVGSRPAAVAASPDGKSIYVTVPGENAIEIINVATDTVTGAIPLPRSPEEIAVTPDGKKAYVVASNLLGEDVVLPVNLTTGAVGAPIEVDQFLGPIAITPDGAHAYVAALNSTVSRIDIATNTVGATIPIGYGPRAIAISPDGTRAYVLGFADPVTPLDLTSDTAGATIPIEEHFLGGVTFAPDGSRAYVTDNDAQVGETDRIVPIATPTNTPGAPIPVGHRPQAIAIVPNQPPHAAFSFSPTTPRSNQAVTFNSSSTDSDGTVARYDWDFGDGTTAANGGPTPSHTYAKDGTYTVTVTTTDNEGCSTTFVFTGQTAYCNGSSVARTTRTVTVTSPSPTCERVEGTVTSFVPKLRSAHIVPGVRVRISVTSPASVTVTSKLFWSKDGQKGSANLRTVTAEVEHWRRVRLALPESLRDKLPIGAKVTVKLRIAATPKAGSGCEGSVTERTLHLRVVKVIPDAVQFGRPR